MHFQRTHRSNHHHRIRRQAGHAALDVQEFFRAQVRAKAGLGDGIIPHLHCHACGNDRIAPVRDVRKGAAVHKCRRTFQRLHQVRFERIFQQRRHSARRLQLAAGDRLVVRRVSHDDVGQPLFQIANRAGQTQYRHDFARDRDVKTILTRHAIRFAAHAVHNKAQLPVVHVDAPFPSDAAHVDAQRVALLDVVVQHRGQQVVRRANCVEVAGEMQIDILHRHHLCVAAAGGAAFDAEHRAERRFAQRDRHVLANATQTVS